MTQENAVFPLPLPTISGSTPQATYNDPSLSGYWHLWGSTGGTRGVNVVKVWDDYRGSGVIVGVIDDGVDYNHPELAGNYASSLDYDGRDGDADAYPSDPTDMHGTTVAGVIAAALNNSAGGAGVAPEASVAGFRIGFGSNGTDQQVLDAFQWMAAVDIANNSWGFGGFLEDSFLYPGFAPIRNALQNALDVGRNGLGTIVVFSAGNGRTSGQDVNYHGFQNNRGIIAAAATDSAGNVTWFSTPGAALLVAAPGQSVPTTDRLGASGYSSGDYATMSGTSFSAPIVSGVAALMLDANPGLGWRDVQEILAATAVQTGATTGWSLNGADNWNGGPMHVSYDYGFGLVDAFAAVRVAESWRGVSTSRNESVTSGAASGPVAIPDVGSLSRTITLTQNLRIDHVEVDVFLTHASIGQLQITLTAPDGTQSLLFHNPATSQADIAFTFSTTRDWGEFSAGDWTLTIADTQSGASGILTNWTLRAYGDAPGNDTYVYTDKFSVLAPADPARRVLSDLGGTDNVNTASIASDTLLDLRPGYSSSIDGQTVVISAGTVIENADTGDGNDVLIGNDAANSLRGWRGNDLLDGGPGADTLEGGVGDDVYVVDSAGDVLVEAATGGNDTVRTTLAAYVLGANLEKLAFVGTGSFSGTGNGTANVITGGFGNDSLNGGIGVDTLIGGVGDDSYYVDNLGDNVVELAGEGNDIVYSSVASTLGANLERISLTGNAAISATGNELANTLYGNGAANVLSGALGDDTYYVGSGDTIVELASEGNDIVYSTVAWTLGANLERISLTGNAAISATGNELANTLYGNGNGAANVLSGGLGDDTYYVGSGDTIVELASEGNDIVYSTVAWTLGANLERISLTGNAAISATGNELANTLYGNGNGAANVLSGGLGDDTYYVGSGDTIVELASGGSDIVYSYGDASLSANVENLYLNVSAAATLTGNELPNRVSGNIGNDILIGLFGSDTLDGGLGADTLIGGAGNDTYYIDNLNDSIVELASEGDDSVYSSVGWTLGANVERLCLTGTAAIAGTGNELANTLAGNANSTANVLAGGLGDDGYYVGSGDSVVELLGEGNDIVYSSMSWTLGSNIERLYLTGSAAITGTANALANTLYGNANSAANVLAGGLGDDGYYVGIGDTVVEFSGEGNDIVYSDISWTLGANVERLYLTGSSAIAGTGNDLANTLYGSANSAANVLAGGLGDDAYYAGAGDTAIEMAKQGIDSVYSYGDYSLLDNIENLYLSNSTAAALTGNELANRVSGNIANDILIGLAGRDTLDGSLGDDILEGGVGDDILFGGGGSDRFVFDTAFGTDRINDFTPGEDVIQLSSALGVTGFSALDTNIDGTLDNGDAGVQIVGADMVLAFGSNQIQIVGQSHLHGNDFFFA